MQISQQLVQNLKKKLLGSQNLQIAYWNEKKTQCWAKSMHHKIHDRWYTIFIMISSLSLVSWMRGWQYPKDHSNYYFRKESKKECQEETTQNKADKLLTSPQRDNQSRRQTKKIELSWNLTFMKLLCNR